MPYFMRGVDNTDDILKEARAHTSMACASTLCQHRR
jgi:hypothetical protein